MSEMLAGMMRVGGRPDLAAVLASGLVDPETDRILRDLSAENAELKTRLESAQSALHEARERGRHLSAALAVRNGEGDRERFRHMLEIYQEREKRERFSTNWRHLLVFGICGAAGLLAGFRIGTWDGGAYAVGWFVAGIFVGTIIGYFIAALAAAGRDE